MDIFNRYWDYCIALYFVYYWNCTRSKGKLSRAQIPYKAFAVHINNDAYAYSYFQYYHICFIDFTARKDFEKNGKQTRKAFDMKGME